MGDVDLPTRPLIENPEYIDVLEKAVEIEDNGGTAHP